VDRPRAKPFVKCTKPEHLFITLKFPAPGECLSESMHRLPGIRRRHCHNFQVGSVTREQLEEGISVRCTLKSVPELGRQRRLALVPSRRGGHPGFRQLRQSECTQAQTHIPECNVKIMARGYRAARLKHFCALPTAHRFPFRHVINKNHDSSVEFQARPETPDRPLV
jgi:hypothetical protein